MMVLGMCAVDTPLFVGKKFRIFTETNKIWKRRSIGILLKGILCLTHLALYLTTLIWRSISGTCSFVLVRFMLVPPGMCSMIIACGGEKSPSV